jgi:hypothetical protein
VLVELVSEVAVESEGAVESAGAGMVESGEGEESVLSVDPTSGI